MSTNPFLAQQPTDDQTIEIVEAADSSWPPVIVALVFSLISGMGQISGSLIGVVTTSCKTQAIDPTSEKDVAIRRTILVAGCLAFGAGMLLFSVTVEMYGEIIFNLEVSGYVKGAITVFVMVLFAALGAFVYVQVDDRVYDASLDGVLECGPREVSEETPLFGKQAAPGWQNVWSSRLQKADPPELQNGETTDEALGMATWRALVYQSLPQGLLIGIGAAQNDLSTVLIISLFMGVLPESFSSACLLREARVPVFRVMSLWASLAVVTSMQAAAVAYAMPNLARIRRFDLDVVCSAVQGFASGAWLSYICGVMLPKAYETRAAWTSLIVVFGFLTAVVVRTFGGLTEELTAAPVMDTTAAVPNSISVWLPMPHP